MELPITIIVVVAMVLGYKIISQIINAIKYRGEHHSNGKQKKQKIREHVIFSDENPTELQARADEMNKRLATLEEILVAEQRS